jgi:hypothetical protein
MISLKVCALEKKNQIAITLKDKRAVDIISKPFCELRIITPSG